MTFTDRQRRTDLSRRVGSISWYVHDGMIANIVDVGRRSWVGTWDKPKEIVALQPYDAGDAGSDSEC